MSTILLPFVGVIEHTNFEPAETYGGRHLIYLSKYLHESDPLYSMTRDEAFTYVLPYLQRMFPAFLPDEIRDMCAYIALHRQSATPIEVAFGNNQYHHDLAEAGDVTATYADAGVTWWLEWCPPGTPLEETRRRIRRGPPTI